METLWNEVQNLKGNLGKYEIKTISTLKSNSSASVTFSFIPKCIFACGFAKTEHRVSSSIYEYAGFSIYFGPVTNGNSVSCSILGRHGASNPRQPDVTLKLSEATATLTGAGGGSNQEISNCKIIAI